MPWRDAQWNDAVTWLLTTETPGVRYLALRDLVGVGHGADPRLANALALIRDKQDDEGRWALEYDYAGKTWGDFGPKKRPNAWVTLRALRVLQAVG
jgi:hypothetical protein